MSDKAGTTRIEMLVLVGCMAFSARHVGEFGLAGRNHAREVLCMSHVRQLSLAWLMYTVDDDGRLVGGNPARVRDAWVKAPQGNGSQFERTLEGIKQGLLWPYVQSIRPYRCPADTRSTEPTSCNYRSYSIAGGMNGEEREWNDCAVLTYLEIERPAEKYVFVADVDPRQYNMGSWIVSRPPKDYWIDPPTAWHDGRTTLGWADGHVTSHRWIDQSTILLFRRAAAGAVDVFNATPPPGEGRDLTYMQDHHQIKNTSQ